MQFENHAFPVGIFGRFLFHVGYCCDPCLNSSSKKLYITYRYINYKPKQRFILLGCSATRILHNVNLVSTVADFYSVINPAFEEFFPKRRVKVSSNDPVFISPLVKSLLNKRSKFIRKGMIAEADSLQPRIDQLIQENQINAVKSRNEKYNNNNNNNNMCLLVPLAVVK